MPKLPVHGRCLARQGEQILIRNQSGTHEVTLTQTSDPFSVGDLVEVSTNGGLRVLTPNRTREKSSKALTHVLDPRRQHGIRTRTRVEAAIREFFLKRDFLETRTPLLVKSPGMEPHIRPFRLETGAYLPTSPEFAMKRLLAGGLERIFQICPAFRLEPESTTHHPEFTMLEWYRAYSDYEQIMRDTEELFEFIALQVSGKPEITYEGRTISVQAPWPRLRTRDLFSEIAKVDLVQTSTAPQLAKECARLGLATSPEDTWDDLYFRIWLNVIEPRLPTDRAVFVTRYPASQAALAVVDSDPDGSRWARRFEAYAGGLELGNAFEELTDPVEQRARFVKDMDLREQIYGSEFPRSPIDETFLHALTEGMPPSGGIAMGVDRIVMLFAGETDISFTQWLPAYPST